MAVAQRMSEEAYEQFVLSGAEGQWELHDGRLVEKPGVTFEHGETGIRLGATLFLQLDPHEFRVRVNDARVRRPADTIFLPDVMVFPTAYGDPFRGQPGKLAIFADPLPLVVEIWSASTGDYDVDTKIPIYQQRGDLEIWRIHPYERTITRWQRQPDGAYTESVVRDSIVQPAALPGVAIDLADLFAD